MYKWIIWLSLTPLLYEVGELSGPSYWAQVHPVVQPMRNTAPLTSPPCLELSYSNFSKRITSHNMSPHIVIQNIQYKIKKCTSTYVRNNHEYSMLLVLPFSLPQGQTPCELLLAYPLRPRFYFQFCSFFLYHTWNALFAVIAISLLYQSLVHWSRGRCPSFRCCRLKPFSFGWSLRWYGRQRGEAARPAGERAHRAGHSQWAAPPARTIRQRKGIAQRLARSGKCRVSFSPFLNILTWVFICARWASFSWPVQVLLKFYIEKNWTHLSKAVG